MGAPAPAELEKVRLFINTLDVEDGTDALADGASATGWLRGAGLLGRSATVDDAGATQLRRLREALRALAVANSGGPVDRKATAVLDRLGRANPVVVRSTPDGVLSLQPASSGADGVAAALLAIVHQASAEGTWPRLKACRADACRWAFYDRSRNRSSTWCTMAVCGNRAKAKAYRERASAR